MPERFFESIIPKHWGAEMVLINNDIGCYKLLYLLPNKLGSKHFHKEKNEVFTCVKGNIRLEYEGVDPHYLSQDDSFVIQPYKWHRFCAIGEPAIILEVSDTHRDSDTFRHEPARDLTPNEIIEMEQEYRRISY
jgi:mannose-6-phosphate isomerase-like protein (cupin superfamily)